MYTGSNAQVSDRLQVHLAAAVEAAHAEGLQLDPRCGKGAVSQYLGRSDSLRWNTCYECA